MSLAFFKTYDHRCGIAKLHQIFLQNNYICALPSKVLLCSENLENFTGKYPENKFYVTNHQLH